MPQALKSQCKTMQFIVEVPLCRSGGDPRRLYFRYELGCRYYGYETYGQQYGLGWVDGYEPRFAPSVQFRRRDPSGRDAGADRGRGADLVFEVQARSLDRSPPQPHVVLRSPTTRRQALCDRRGNLRDTADVERTRDLRPFEISSNRAAAPFERR